MSLAVRAIHYLLISRILPDRAVMLALVLVIGTWILVILRLDRYVGAQLDFVLENSRYGIITKAEYSTGAC